MFKATAAITKPAQRSSKIIKNTISLLAIASAVMAFLPASFFGASNSFASLSSNSSTPLSDEAQYHLNLIPLEYRVKIEPVFESSKALTQFCRDNGYGPWTRKLENDDDVAARDRFMLAKLNRPYYLVHIAKDEWIGRSSDYLETRCWDEMYSANQSTISPAFIADATKNSSLNFFVMDVLINLWDLGLKDTPSALSILSHPLTDRFLIKKLLQDAFDPQFPRDRRLELIRDLMQSTIYSENPAQWNTHLISAIQCAQFSPESVYEVMALVIKQHIRTFSAEDAKALTAKAIWRVIPGTDYGSLFYKISEGQSLELRASMLLDFMNSDMEFAEAGSIFYSYYAKITEPKVHKALFNYLLWVPNSGKRLLLSLTIAAISAELDKASFTEGQAQILVSLLMRDQFPTAERLDLLQRLLLKAPQFPKLVGKMINASEIVIGSGQPDPTIQLSLCSAISGNISSYWSDPAVLQAYVGLFSFITDPKLTTSMAEPLLSAFTVDENFLSRQVDDALEVWSDQAYRVITLILQQSAVSAQTLRSISLGFRHLDKLTPRELYILEVINSKPQVEAEIKKFNEKTIARYAQP